MKKNTSITVKLLYAFFVIIFLSVGVFSVFTYKVFSKNIVDKTTERTLQMLEQIGKNIDSDMKQLKYAVSSIGNNDDILKMISNISESENLNRLELTTNLDNKLDYYFTFTDIVKSIIFFTKDGKYYYYKQSPNIEQSEIKKLKWYRQSISNKDKVITIGRQEKTIMEPYCNYVFSMAFSPSDEHINHNIEMIYFAFKDNAFENVYSYLELNHVGEIFIFDNDGKTIVTEDIKSNNQNITNTLQIQNRFNNKYGYFLMKESNIPQLITYYHELCS